MNRRLPLVSLGSLDIIVDVRDKYFIFTTLFSRIFFKRPFVHQAVGYFIDKKDF